MTARISTRTALIGVFVLAVALTVGFLLIQGPAGAEPPTRDQAVESLETAIDLALTQGASSVCEAAASPSLCTQQLEQAGPVPPNRPTLECTGVLGARGNISPGIIMEVSGTSANGAPYSTTVLAITEGKAVKLINAVYWSGAGIDPGPTTEDPATCK